MPFYIEIDEPINGLELSEQLGIQKEDVEVIFVNGFVQQLDYLIQPGDRIAFLPPGCPGPYRIALGFYGKNQDNDANFVIQNGEGVYENNSETFCNLERKSRETF
ncbi:MoaD/ThiS family protein [Anaerotignum propionicum]|uniref:MoaD/ThiS family protein n=1 Tax=Anaerotignum propionicum TaxID=28446 RepID=UPI003AB92263